MLAIFEADFFQHHFGDVMILMKSLVLLNEELKNI